MLIEDAKLTRPVKDVNIIGNGPKVLSLVDMVADNLKIDEGGWTCGKNGQSVPVMPARPSAGLEHRRRRRRHELELGSGNLLQEIVLDVAHQVVDRAKKQGATQVAATAYRVRDVDVEWRDGKLQKISEATTRGVRGSPYVDGRHSNADERDLRTRRSTPRSWARR